MTTPSTKPTPVPTSCGPSSGIDPSAYEAMLDCIHCGLCLTACPTYDALGLEPDSPRGRIYLMRALAEGTIEDPSVVRPHLDRCLDCRACETACPSGVRYGHILESVRSDLETATPTKGLGASIRRFLLRRVVARQNVLRFGFKFLRLGHLLRLDRLAAGLRLLPSGMRRLLPDVPAGRHRRPLPTGLHRPPADVRVRGRVALFTGCVMEQMFGDINRKTLELLLRNGFEVDIPAQQGCCGALLIHNGQAGDARPLAKRNLEAFASADIVINNSAGCGAALKEYGDLLHTDAGTAFGAKCRDVTEFLAEAGLIATPANTAKRVAYDDPCHLCHAQRVSAAPRKLLSQVPDIELVAHPTASDCCGSAGIYNLIHDQLASQIGQRKVRALIQTKPELIVTGNPGCMMQLRAHLKAAGAKIPVQHTVELLMPPDCDSDH